LVGRGGAGNQPGPYLREERFVDRRIHVDWWVRDRFRDGVGRVRPRWLDLPMETGILPALRVTARDVLSAGAVAQLGERLHGMQEVVGSIPISSTFPPKPARVHAGRFTFGGSDERSYRCRMVSAPAFGSPSVVQSQESVVMKSTDLRPGMCIRLDGDLHVISQFQHVTPGNLRAFIQIKIKSIRTGASVEKRLRSGEDIEQVNLDRRTMEYLYRDSGGFVFMDSESFEQETLPEGLVGDSMPYVKPNQQITVLVAEGRCVSIELPSIVELTVTETAPAVKGATATNQLKEAELETGLRVRVPPFISNDDVIRVNTVDGSYNSRA